MEASTGSEECPELVYDGVLDFLEMNDTLDVPLYTEVTGGISVGSIPGLQDLQFLRCLRVVGSVPVEGRGFGIRRNPDLVSLAGLERLETAHWLTILENPALETLDGLDNLRIVTKQLVIDDNPALRSIRLPGLEEAPQITIGGVVQGDFVTNDPFPTYRCEPGGNVALEEVANLDSLRRFDRIDIWGNEALTSIQGMHALVGATPLNPDLDTAQINVARNPSLPLPAVEELAVALGGAPAVWSCGNEDEAEPCEFCTLEGP